MARVLVVTQGALGEELARGAHTIAGSSTRIETVSLDWNESPAESEEKVAAALASRHDQADARDGVLILTDVPGGTPFRVAAKFARPNEVEVLSGVNLPMLVRLCCPGCRDGSVSELADWLIEKGRSSISHYQPSGKASGNG